MGRTSRRRIDADDDGGGWSMLLMCKWMAKRSTSPVMCSRKRAKGLEKYFCKGFWGWN